MVIDMICPNDHAALAASPPGRSFTLAMTTNEAMTPTKLMVNSLTSSFNHMSISE
jgi:hypothetical protein